MNLNNILQMRKVPYRMEQASLALSALTGI